MYLAKKLATLLTSWFVPSIFETFEQHPSGTGKDIGREVTGTDRVIEAPDGIITVSVLAGCIEGLGVCTKAIEGGLEVGAVAVGTVCCDAIAS